MALIAILVAGGFAALCLMHVYWAAGGTWGKDAAIPSLPRRPDAGLRATPAFTPTPGMTLMVACGLALIAVLAAQGAGLIGAPLRHWTLQSALGLTAVLMLARAVGDFRLVGFFKTVKGSRFARLDSWLYSPLCVLLGVGLGLIAAH